jgi:hypothetical protein
MTAAKKVDNVNCSGEAIYDPTVLATSLLTKAPQKLRMEQKIIALVGDKTRVEITVAIAPAASFQPLDKS